MTKPARALTLLSLSLLTQLSVSAATQTITFPAIPNQIFGVSPFVIAAKADSGLPVSFNSTTPAVCRTAGSLVTLLSVGPCYITASQSGNGSFSPASATRNFTVSLAKPSGTLTLASGSPYAAGTTQPVSLTVGDFNRDGFQDIVVGGPSVGGTTSALTVLLGNGSGGFTAAPGSPSTVGINIHFVVPGDFNGDGIQDLAAVDALHHQILILLGDGSAGFAPAAGGPVTVGSLPVSVVVGDFNGDGTQDLAVANSSTNSVTILLGDGLGGFSASAGSPFVVGTGPYCLAVGDFNGDGIQDLVVTNGFVNNVTVLLGNGSGGFAPAAGSPFAVPTGSYTIAVTDLNRDGNQDLALADGRGGSVTVLLGNGLGGFAPVSGSPFAAGQNLLAPIAGDFNGDGIPDLAIADTGAHNIVLLLGTGSGGFATAPGSPFAAGELYTSLAVGDFNGDGAQDLALANLDSGTVTVLLGGLAPTSSVLSTISQPTIFFGQAAALNLAVSPPGASFNLPTGTATFFDGATFLGAANQNGSPYTFSATGLSGGAHTLTATYGGGAGNASSTSNTITVQISRATQTISFGPLSNAALGAGTVTLTATASSNLAVSFTSTTAAVCTVTGNTITLVTLGVCSIEASQAGSGDYTPATSVTRSFVVGAFATSATIAANTTWTLANSPITVTGNVLVAAGATLTIEAGVTVKFAPGTVLQVNGQLIARGTAASPIVFTSNQATPAPGQWGYVLFSSSSTGATFDGSGNYQSGSILEYVSIDSAGANVSGSGISYAVSLVSATPFINHATIHQNSGAGISITNPTISLVKITNSTLMNNSTGVSANVGGSIGGTVVLQGNTITNNTIGVDLNGYANGVATIIGNVISNNNGDGLRANNDYATLTIANNTIAGNQAGIDITDDCCAGSLSITGNLVRGNTGGGGIFINRLPGVIVVSGNIIVNNTKTGSGVGGGIYVLTDLENGGSGGITLTNNVIANNTASVSAGGAYLNVSAASTIRQNSITGNTAPTHSALEAVFNGNYTYSLSQNTITQNQTTVAGGSAIAINSASASLTVSQNNWHNNATTYTLENLAANTAPALNAANNWWGTTNATAIQSLIYDFSNNGARGVVSSGPALGAINIMAPVSPPANVVATAAAGSVSLNWAANPEPNIAGYRIYYGTQPGLPYQGTGATQGPSPVDVGNVTSYSLSGLPAGTEYITVTAYNTSHTGAATDETNGFESAYAREETGIVGGGNTLASATLIVTKAGTGAGILSSNPIGIICGADCAQAYANGTTVTLTATPDTASVFAGWSGACVGTGSCVVSMTPNRSVTATFTQTSASPPSGVTGGISSNTTWTLANSPITVTGNVLVAAGATLTIEAGVTVKFAPGTVLQVNGQLIARGTAASPIVFTSNQATPASAQWGYVLFSSSSTGATFDGSGNYQSGSILEYVSIDSAGANVSGSGISYAVSLVSATPFINHATIHQNSGAGISINNPTPSLVKITNSTLSNNGSGVVANLGGSGSAGGTVALQGNTITNNTTGVNLTTYAHGVATLTGNVISNNNGAGIAVPDNAYGSLTIANNTITANQAGIQVADSCCGGSISITGNLVQGNTPGGAITINVYPDPLVINGNIIVGNTNTAGYNGGFPFVLSPGIGGAIWLGDSFADPDSGTLSLTNNVISNNVASVAAGGIYMKWAGNTTIQQNSITGNSAPTYSALEAIFNTANNPLSQNTVTQNTITQNQATTPGGSAVVINNVSSNLTLSHNNWLNNTATYALENLTSNTGLALNAQNNWWGTTNATAIQSLIYDFSSNGARGVVTYAPALGAINTTAPVSPPANVVATGSAGSVSLNWAANPEPNIAGYRVYYGSRPGPPYVGTGATQGPSPVDVGNVTSYSLSGLPAGTQYVAVTAYNTSHTGAVNDQPNGFESAYPSERPTTVNPAPQTITFGSLSNVALGSGTVTLTATASSGLRVTYASNSGSVCTVSGAIVTLAAYGTCSITATQTGGPNYTAAASVTQTFTVSPSAPSIAEVAPSTIPAYSPATSLTIAGSNFISGATVSFTPPNGTTQTITPTRIQAAQIAATIPAAYLTTAGTAQVSVNNGFTAFSNQLPFTITTINQTISFAPIPDQLLGVSPLPIVARTNSGLPIAIASTTPAVCKTAGTLVTLVSAGTCSITASQAANVGYLAAPVTRSFQVFKATPSSSYTTTSALFNPPLPFVSIATADFNGDGIPDAAVLDNTNVVRVLLGDGSGAFTTPGSSLSPGGQVYSVVAGDFNTDGKSDLALSLSGSVVILLGDGAGHFTPSPGAPAAIGQYGNLRVGDFNNDGAQDLAITTADSVTRILWGDGTGGLALASGFVTTGRVLAAVDFDGDGILDLLTTPNYLLGTLTTMLGDGKGSFAAVPGRSFATGFEVISVAVGDFDGDGLADVAVGTYGNGVPILISDGSGGFHKSGTAAVTGTYLNPVTGDFDGDGIQDLAVLSHGENYVTIMLGNGSGGFTAAAGGPIPAGIGAYSMVAGDLNGDGIEDLLVGGSGNLIELLGFAAGHTSQIITFGPLSNVPVGTTTLNLSASSSSHLTVSFSSNSQSICAVAGNTVTLLSIDLPGDVCAVTARQPGDSSYAPATPITQTFLISPPIPSITSVTPNTTPALSPATQITIAGSSFAANATVTFTPPGGTPQTITPAQIQAAQIAATIPAAYLTTAGTAQISVNNGFNAFSNQSPFLITTLSQTITFNSIPDQILGFSPFQIVASASPHLPITISSTTTAVCKTSGTLVTLVSPGTCSISASQSGSANYVAAASVTRSFTVNQAKPSGSFLAASGSPFKTGTNPYSIIVADFNGDGLPDLATANIGNNSVAVFLGDGAGGFTSSGQLSVGLQPDAIASGDFNGDGIPDLVTANSSGNDVTVLLGNGKGGFTPAQGSPFAVGSNPTSVSVGDFNGDGIQDLAVVNHIGRSITVLLGNGSGGFATNTVSPFGLTESPCCGVVGDFNGDGIQDLVTVDPTNNRIRVLLGDGLGGFTTAPGGPISVTSPGQVVVADFNGDGNQDLAITIADFSGKRVEVLLGNGSGAFSASSGIPVGHFAFPNSLVVGDFNGDAIPDLAVTDSGNNIVSVFLGDGSGGFAVLPGNQFSAGNDPASVAVGDFNGDGVQDLAITSYLSNDITVLLGFKVGNTYQEINSFTTPDVVSGTAPFSISGTASSGLPVNFASATPSVCTVLGTTVTILNWGGCNLFATQPGNATFAPAPAVTRTVSVTQTQQTISFGPLSNIVYGGTPSILNAIANSGLAVTYTSTTMSVCTISNNAIVVLTAGTCAITATQSGNNVYAAATPVSLSFTISKVPQTITFAALNDVTTGTAFGLSATATSGLAVTFSSSTSNTCSVTGTTVNTFNSGTCTIVASQGGNTNYAAASPVTQSFNVSTNIYSGPANCTSTASNAVFVRSEGRNEQVADLVLSCTSGASATMNLTIYLSPAVNITSAAVISGANAVSETTAGLTGLGLASGIVHGVVSGSSVVFNGISTPPGAFSITVTNIKIDAATVATASGAPTAVSETVFVGGTNVTPGVTIAPAVAYVTNGLTGVQATGVTANPVCTAITTASPSFNVQFSEGFANAFKVQGVAAANSAIGSQLINNSETGFGVVANSTSNAATSGTRIKIVFHNIPANLTLTIPNTISSGGSTLTLTTTETGPFSAVGSPGISSVLAVAGGSATAIYEKTAGPAYTAASATTFSVPIYLSAAAGAVTASPNAITATVSFAPIGASANVPNFVSGSSTTTVNGSTFTACGPGTPQTISFAPLPNVPVTSSPLTLSASSSSGLPVNFTSTTLGVCATNGNALILTSAGTCSITASQSGDSTWAAATPVIRTFTITSSNAQTISFQPLTNVTTNSPSVSLSASATSGLPVSFASTTPAICTVSGNTVSVGNTPGTCSISATQSGNGTWAAAPAVTNSFAVVVYTGPATCTASANAVFVRAEGKTEQVADTTLTCTGGNALPMNLTVYLSPAVNISSTVLSNGSSEILALLNGSSVNAVPGVASSGTVTFTGVPTAFGAFNLTLTNIRVDAASIVATSGTPTAIAETFFLSGPAVSPAILGGVNVAFVANGLTGVNASAGNSYPVCLPLTAAAPIFNVQFAEGFPNAFKVQGSAASNSALNSWSTNNTETGYGVVTGSVSNTATSGTRVEILFQNLPADAALYVPLTISANGGTMTLTASGIGPFSAVAASGASGAPASTALLPTVSIVGSARGVIAIYEETTSAPGTIETYTVPVYLVASGGAVTPQAAITASVGFVPLETNANIPNFATRNFTPVNGSTFVACGLSAATQAIQFDPLNDVPATSGTVTLTASASSSLPVTFSSNNLGVCTVAGNVATIKGPGSCSITASQPGDANYAPATPVTRTFITGSTNAQTISFAPLVNRASGSPQFTIAATATSGLAVTFTSTTPSVCTVSLTTVTITGLGTCSITATQPGNSSYLAATSVTQTFSVLNPASSTSCSTAYSNAVFVRSESTDDQVGDLTIQCLGNGLPVNLQVFLSPSISVTSATLGTGAGATSEALAGLNNTPTTLTGATIPGVVSGSSLTFNGVPTAAGPTTLTITNVRVNASRTASSSGVPTAITETVFVGGSSVIPAVLPSSNVAFATNGLTNVKLTGATSSPVCSAINGSNPAFSVQFSEGFPNAFKIRGSAAANSTLGAPYPTATETGYGVTASGVSNTATSGTRIKVVFNNIPSGNLVVYVPVTTTNNGATLTLTNSETAAYSAVPPSTVSGAPAGAAALTVVGGSATAVYETTVVSTAPATFSIPVYITAAAGAIGAPATITATVSFAPIGATANVPNFVVGSGTATLNGNTFTKCASAITFPQPGNVVFGSGNVTLSATASSSLDVAFTSTTPSVCSVQGNIVTLESGGECSITASQTGNSYYAAAPNVIQSFTITPASQTITFATPPDIPLSAGPTALIATASSGLPVAFGSTTTAVCTVNGTKVTPLALGVCSVSALQAGDLTNYSAALLVSRSFNVTIGAQTISFAAIPNQIFGTSPFMVTAKAGSGLPVSIASTTPSVCKSAGGLIQLLSAGTCSITATQPGNGNFAAALSVSRTFTVNTAKPSGAFTPVPGILFPAASNLFLMVTGDFDGDGARDLATAAATSDPVTAIFGDGSGGFTASSAHSGSGNLVFLTSGDFDGDGITDLVSGTGQAGGVVALSTRFGDSKRFFTSALTNAGSFTAGPGPFPSVAGDFNGDGILDLAVANGGDTLNGSVAILLGNGLGGFTESANSPVKVGKTPVSIVTGDFNGDGIQDLATANSGSTNLTILLGNGAGGFTATAVSPSLTGVLPGSLTVGDFNRDGIYDLAVTLSNQSAGNVVVFLGDGSGGFTTAAGSPFTAGSNPNSVVTGDFNGDGIQDLVAARDGGVTFLLGNGSGAFTTSVDFPLTTAVTPRSLIAGDFNSDGVPDVAVLDAVNGKVTLLSGGHALTGSVLSTPSPLTITYGQPVPLSLTVSGTTPAFSSPTGTATLSDGAALLGSADQTSSPYTFIASSLIVGTHTLTATYSGDSRTAASTSNPLTIQVNKASQTITFVALPNVPFSPSQVTLTATASSSLPATYVSTTGATCTVTGNKVSLVSVGFCLITASQPGDSNYLAATDVQQGFTVAQAPQTITFAAPVAVTLPASAVNLTATSTSGLAVSFASTTISVCTVHGTAVTPLTAGTCTITASQVGNDHYLAATPVTQSFTVNPAPSSGGSGGGGGGGGAPPAGGSPLTVTPNSVTIEAASGGAPGTQTVTLTYPTFSQGAPAFSTNLNTNQGQGWLSISPASGTMSLASTSGLLFTYSATLTISGDPTGLNVGNTYTGTINVSSAGGIASVPVTLNVSSQPANYTVAPQSLSFSFQQGTAVTPPDQSISVFRVPTGATFTATATSTGNWLTAGAGGKTPGAVAVSVDVSKLSPGTFTGTVTISSGANTNISVPVTLTITKANPPILSVSPASETLSSTTSGQVTVTNTGGGTLQFAASSDQSWLNVSGAGSATSTAPASLAFTTDTSSLKPGVYTAHITVSDANSSAQSVVSVVLTVPAAATPTILLSKSGVTLAAVAGGSAPQSQSVTVTNSGTGTLNWSTQVSTTSGGSWLTATSSANSISISASTNGLAAGQYYGSLNVVAANATNNPQTISVALNIAAAASTPGIQLSTGGVLLFGSVPQSVTLYNPASSPGSYTAAAFTQNGTNWLSVNPASGTLNAGANTIQIAADSSSLSAGVQSGTVTLAFGDGSITSIQVVSLVLPKSAGSIRGGLQPLATVAACPSGKASYLIPIFRLPSTQTTIQVAAATTLQAQVIDDCGNAVTSGAVQVTFNNGDPAINLNSIGAGIWEATWVPQNVPQNAAKSANLQLAASQNGLTGNPSLNSLSTITVAVQAAGANAAPQPTGIANAASAAQATPQVVAPGSYVAIYGTGLAGAGNPSATSLPLPTTLNGTQLFLGGLPMPLLYAGPGQVNALVPEGIAPNATYPLVVVRGTAQSVPVALTVTELQPGAYTVNTSGSGAGIVTNAVTGQLITSANPAHSGDYLVIYSTGLGALTGTNGEPQPADGAAASGTIIYRTTANVTVTIGGVPAPVLYSGLTPTFAGLYQVNVQVPAGVTPSQAIPIILTATDPVTGATAAGNTVTVVVQ